MRKTSLLCTILNSLSLSLFEITYNIQSVYCLSIIWSISCGVFACNFIRNRNFITKCCTSIKIKKTDVIHPQTHNQNKHKHKTKGNQLQYGQRLIFSMESPREISMETTTATCTKITSNVTNINTADLKPPVPVPPIIFGSKSCSNFKKITNSDLTLSGKYSDSTKSAVGVFL